jgi:hypothetical protein
MPVEIRRDARPNETHVLGSWIAPLPAMPGEPPLRISVPASQNPVQRPQHHHPPHHQPYLSRLRYRRSPRPLPLPHRWVWIAKGCWKRPAGA